MKPLFYLNKYFIKYRWRLLLGILFIVISNYFGVEMPRIIGESIDYIKENLGALGGDVVSTTERTALIEKVTAYALLTAGLYLLFSLLKGLFLFFTRQTIIVMSRYVEYDLKNEIYKHYQELDQGFYKEQRTGDLMNRISEDVSHVRMYLGPAVMYTINLLVLFVMAIWSMAQVNMELTLYALTPLPLMSVIIYFVSRTINAKSEKVQRQQSKLTTFVQEAFSGIRVLKSYGREKAFGRQFNDESSAYRDRNLELVKVNAFFLPTITTLIGLSTIITIWVGGIKALNNEISVGDIASFVIYVNMLTWPFASVGWVTSLVQRAAASQHRINEFLQSNPSIKNEVNDQTPVKGDLEFRNVSFTYPGSGITAVRNLSFHAKPGQSIAIIGRTGSGKSTIANLLCRLYDPSEGAVLLDGKDLRHHDLNHLRESIGYVPQEVFLFSDTIANNIGFGLEEGASSAQIEQAAKDADVYHNIIEFNEQFETMLGERGINLSGGQKQRISIARAIIKDPEILIFDDCLSAVDTETEEKILGNLRQLMRGRTSVIISHRVSTVRSADCILVLDEGHIMEQGTHQELLTEKGVYYELYHKQLIESEKIDS